MGASFRIVPQTTNLSLSSQSIIQYIYISLDRRKSTDAKLPTIADLYDNLGEPETVRLFTGVEKERVTLLYKEQRIEVFLNDLDCDKILMNEEITQIVLVDPAPKTYVAWLSKPQAWRGFGRCYWFVREIFP